MAAASSHRLDGLEPDNLLAFLALLGLLRALEAGDRALPDQDRLYPRVAWGLDKPPLRPVLVLRRPVSAHEVAERAAAGVALLAEGHGFDQADLNYSRTDCHALLAREAHAAFGAARDRADLLAALMSDAAVKDDKAETVDPTPLCLLFGQGHQHFLDRLAKVPAQPSPPPRGKGKTAVTLSAEDCLEEALFHPWHRNDPTPAFRWDPDEDVRYALMAGDPTDTAYKPGTQHGANRLAAVGLAVLWLAPETRAGRVRPAIVGGQFGADGFSLAWPVWRGAATLAAIRALMLHPDLRKSGGLDHLGVDHVLEAKRISTNQYINFSRARPVVAA